jgi:hypothetical protein
MIRKLRRATTAPVGLRGGDALLFAKSPLTFVSAQSDEIQGHVRQGGLTDAESRIGLLVASKALEEDITNGFRIAPLELNDLAPTITRILRLEGDTKDGRPAFLEWVDGPSPTLGFAAADRTIRATARERTDGVIWAETKDTVTLGRVEAAAHWPPESIKIRFGSKTSTWDADKERFEGAGKCAYAEEPKTRSWRCTFPVERGQPRVTPAVVRRLPSTTGADLPHDDIAFPVILGATVPQFEGPPELVCATEERLRIRTRSRDELGLARLEVFVGDDRIDPSTGISGSLARGVRLTELNPGAECERDLMDPRCTYGLSAVADDVVEVPFTSSLVNHHQQVRGLRGARRIDGQALNAKFHQWSGAEPEVAAAQGAPPQTSWLGVTVCNLAGICRHRALATDVEYRRLLSKGCP